MNDHCKGVQKLHPLQTAGGIQDTRVIMRDNIPWFVAADVCVVLSIANNRDAVSRLDDDERGVATTDTPSGDQQMLVINESSLYNLILTSRKPQAKRFKKWHDNVLQGYDRLECSDEFRRLNFQVVVHATDVSLHQRNQFHSSVVFVQQKNTGHMAGPGG